MSFRPGKHKTKGNHKAVVGRVRSTKGKWVLEGAIICPETGVYVLHDWRPDGTSIAVEADPRADVFSLKPRRA